MTNLPLRIRRGVARCHRVDLLAFRDWVEPQVELRHKIPIHVVPAPTVVAPDGQVGLGAFAVHSDRIEIWVAADLTDVERDHPDLGADDMRAIVLESLMHELMHYEQWRDGRAMNHRGVEQRAQSAVQKFFNECCSPIVETETTGSGCARCAGRRSVPRRGGRCFAARCKRRGEG